MKTIRPEYCRECRDELPYGTWPLPLAEFILWGKFFPPEAFGPKCYKHTAKWVQYMADIHQYAVFDLRPMNAVLMNEVVEFDKRGLFDEANNDQL